jgi:Tfp pilus assembly pilus retraction ATPase PilT
MFDNDQQISKNEKKQLLKFLKRHKKFFQPKDKEKIAEVLNETLQLSFISHFLKTNDTKKTMFLESLKLTKNIINTLKDYKDSFKKLDGLIINFD